MFTLLLLFVLFFSYSIVVSDINNKQLTNFSLIVICILLALMAGLKDKGFWLDTSLYLEAFFFDIKPFKELDLSSHVSGYSEKGFILLSSIIKSISTNETFYLTIISIITLIFLFIDFRKYSIFPLIGVCVYISRFYIGRNLIQIRAALAIAIVLLCIYYAHERKLFKFLFVVTIASLFHTTMVIVYPFYWINKLKIKKRHIVICLILSFIATVTVTPYLRPYLMDFADSYDYNSYVSETSSKAYGLGLLNPMIYYQCFLLLSFTFFQDRIKDICSYYFEFRNAYLYSTIIIIVLSQWAIASGRLSTIFATVEIGIIPCFLYVFNNKFRWVMYFIIGLATSLILYQNLLRFLSTN